MSEQTKPEHAPGQPCRVTGGKYNGFAGTIRWMGDVWCSFVVIYEGKPVELVEELKAFTTEMRARELEMQTAKAHFEKLQADEEARLAAEPATETVASETVIPVEAEQLELDFRPV